MNTDKTDGSRANRAWTPALAGALLCGVLTVFAGRAHAAARNPATDWFQKAGYGVFTHYLEDLQNDPTQIQSLGRKTTWDECVREFDVVRFASAMHEAGAGYVIFTMHQRTPVFDRAQCHLRPAHRLASRARRAPPAIWWRTFPKRSGVHGIPLMLYWTGDGPPRRCQGRRRDGLQ